MAAAAAVVVADCKSWQAKAGRTTTMTDKQSRTHLFAVFSTTKIYLSCPLCLVTPLRARVPWVPLLVEYQVSHIVDTPLKQLCLEAVVSSNPPGEGTVVTSANETYVCQYCPIVRLSALCTHQLSRGQIPNQF